MSKPIETKKTKIEELSKWDMDTREIPDGYNMTSIPDNTAGNIKIMMNKINELVRVVNVLTKHNLQSI